MEVKEPGNRPHIDVSRCTGCGRCVAACDERRLTLETVGHRKHAAAVQESAKCPLCGKCQEACLVDAINL